MADDFRVAVKEEFWRFHLERQGAGNESIGVYCRKHGLAESSFYFWRKKIERRDAGRNRPLSCSLEQGQVAQSPGRSGIRSIQKRVPVVSCSVPDITTSRCERSPSERIGLVALEIVGDASQQSPVTTASSTLEITCPSGVVIRLREEVSSEVLQRVIVACEQSHRAIMDSAAEVPEVR